MMKFAVDNHRRGKSVRPTTAVPQKQVEPQVIVQQKKGLKNKIKNAFRNFF